MIQGISLGLILMYLSIKLDKLNKEPAYNPHEYSLLGKFFIWLNGDKIEDEDFDPHAHP